MYNSFELSRQGLDYSILIRRASPVRSSEMLGFRLLDLGEMIK